MQIHSTRCSPAGDKVLSAVTHLTLPRLRNIKLKKIYRHESIRPRIYVIGDHETQGGSSPSFPPNSCTLVPSRSSQSLLKGSLSGVAMVVSGRASGAETWSHIRPKYGEGVIGNNSLARPGFSAGTEAELSPPPGQAPTPYCGPWERIITKNS